MSIWNYSHTPTDKGKNKKEKKNEKQPCASYCPTIPSGNPDAKKATTAALGLGRQKPRAWGAITKRPDLFPGLLFPSKTTMAQRDTEENWKHCNPERNEEEGVYVIPREKGAERNSAEKEK